MNIFWKYDNKDVLVVEGAEDAAEAWDAAESFLSEVGEEYSTGLSDSNDLEPNENGSYMFCIKCY